MHSENFTGIWQLITEQYKYHSCLPAFPLLSDQTLGSIDKGTAALPHLRIWHAASFRCEILLNYHKSDVVLIAEFSALGVLWLFSLPVTCVV